MHIRYYAPFAASLLLGAFVVFPAAARQDQPMMQHGMGMPMTGNQDVDFARMMIPHHQSAIDMARAQLEKGKDRK